MRTIIIIFMLLAVIGVGVYYWQSLSGTDLPGASVPGSAVPLSGEPPTQAPASRSDLILPATPPASIISEPAQATVPVPAPAPEPVAPAPSFIILPVPAPAPVPIPTPAPAPAAAVPPSQPSEVNAAIKGFAFSPREIRVPAGTKIVWTNQDSSSHTVSSDTAIFESPFLPQGAAFSRVFNDKGIFPYHCEPHPGMRGSIIVE